MLSRGSKRRFVFDGFCCVLCFCCLIVCGFPGHRRLLDTHLVMKVVAVRAVEPLIGAYNIIFRVDAFSRVETAFRV